MSLDTETEATLAKLPADQQAKIRKALNRQSTRRVGEDEILAKYPFVVEGSLAWDENAGKQAVTISCIHPDCSSTRKVFTSDLFQVKVCLEHRKAQRQAAKAELKKLIAEVKAKK